MPFLKLKDEEIEKLKANLVQKDNDITTLKGTATQKDQEAKDTINSKNQMKERFSKYTRKLVGKTILKYARYILWN